VALGSGDAFDELHLRVLNPEPVCQEIPPRNAMATIAASRATHKDDADPLGLASNRSQLTYTSCYCEENVWKMCEKVRDRTRANGGPSSTGDILSRCFVAFISNPSKKVPLWYQKAGADPANRPVVWDYHVILIFDGRGMTSSPSSSPSASSSSWVYDLDTCLPFPTDYRQYFDRTFRNDDEMKSTFKRFFRVIPAEEYLRHFASDRRHMVRPDGSWAMPPPDYPPLVAADGVVNNIDKFIDVTQKQFPGKVLDAKEMRGRFA